MKLSVKIQIYLSGKYKINPYPSRYDLINMASEVDVEVIRVQVWYIIDMKTSWKCIENKWTIRIGSKTIGVKTGYQAFCVVDADFSAPHWMSNSMLGLHSLDPVCDILVMCPKK